MKDYGKGERETGKTFEERMAKLYAKNLASLTHWVMIPFQKG